MEVMIDALFNVPWGFLSFLVLTIAITVIGQWMKEASCQKDHPQRGFEVLVTKRVAGGDCTGVKSDGAGFSEP